MDSFSTVSIIRDEHRRLGALVLSAQHLATEAVNRGARPDARLLTLILDYIDAFPDRYHHPKEDRHLFTALRSRTSEADRVLAELESEHVRAREMAGQLRTLLSACEEGGADAVEAFSRAVNEYAEFLRHHARKEEDVVLPLAERVVTAADWRTIQAAFQSNDMLHGAEEFRKLFHNILRLAPPAVLRLLVAVDL